MPPPVPVSGDSPVSGGVLASMPPVPVPVSVELEPLHPAKTKRLKGRAMARIFEGNYFPSGGTSSSAL